MSVTVNPAWNRVNPRRPKTLALDYYLCMQDIFTRGFRVIFLGIQGVFSGISVIFMAVQGNVAGIVGQPSGVQVDSSWELGDAVGMRVVLQKNSQAMRTLRLRLI